MSETERLEERLGAWAAEPMDSGDWTEVMRRAGQRPSARSLTQRRLVLALAVAVVVAGSLVGGFVAQGTGPAPARSVGPRPEGPSASSPPDGSNPWGPEARQITIEELRAEAPYIPLPSSDLANDGNVGTVWVLDRTSDPTEPVNHVVASVYYPGSGIQLSWARSGIAYDGAPLPTRMVDGVRAMLMDDWTGEAPTETAGSTRDLESLSIPVGPDEMLTLRGVVPTTDLIDVAQSLSPLPGDASPAGDLPLSNPQPGPYLTTWDGPPAYDMVAVSLDDAAGSLPFEPVAPTSLGDPSAIVESKSDGVLSLRYDDAADAPFWLLERPSGSATAALLRDIAADCSRASGCKAPVASMIDLGEGVSGLDVEDPVSDRIVWVDRGVYYELVGNATTLTHAKALAAAREITAAAAGS